MSGTQDPQGNDQVAITSMEGRWMIRKNGLCDDEIRGPETGDFVPVIPCAPASIQCAALEAERAYGEGRDWLGIIIEAFAAAAGETT